MAILSRSDLIDYSLRRLGAPVLEINVELEQLEDRVDEAIQYYQEYHSDATVPVFANHELTQLDIDNKFITIPEDIIYIHRVLPLSSSNGSSSESLFNAQYQMNANDEYLLRGRVTGNTAYYYQTQQHISLVNGIYNNGQPIRFNRHTNRLYVDVDWNALAIGEFIVMEGDSLVDPETYTDIYNDHYLKMYVTALIKHQWGQNMVKFDGMILPGGVTVNSRQMIEDANLEIEKLKEEMRLVWEEPVNFYAG
jgi:hypothetical protein